MLGPPSLAPFWRVAVLALAPAIGLGIARFAYGLLLPEMRTQLDWSYSQAGWMNTVNALGYLIGALITAPLAKRVSLSTLVTLGVWGSVVAIAATGMTQNFFLLSAWRLIVGITGAFCFVAGGAIAASLASARADRSGTTISLFYAGPGLGIVLSGALVPPFLLAVGPQSWPLAWIALGLLTAILACLTIRSRWTFTAQANALSAERPAFELRTTMPLLLAYMAYGAGSIGYMTFMFAFLKQHGVGTTGLALFWVLIGGASMMSPWLWGGAITKLTRGNAVAMLTLVTLVGAVIPLLSTVTWMPYLSAAIFGCALFSVPAAITAFVRRNVRTDEWTKALGILTIAFGLGQVFGPVASGLVSDLSGDLATGLTWGCGFLLLGALIAIWQRDLVTNNRT